MSINAKIKDAEYNHQKWARITVHGSHSQYGKTEVQAIMLREYFEGMLDGLTEAKLLIRVES